MISQSKHARAFCSIFTNKHDCFKVQQSLQYVAMPMPPLFNCYSSVWLWCKPAQPHVYAPFYLVQHCKAEKFRVLIHRDYYFVIMFK